MSNIPPDLILEQFELGPLANFLYFIGDAKSKEIAVVDPAWDVDLLCEQADTKGYTVKAVFLTHGHPDHVNGLEKFLSRYDVPAYISKYEAPFYKPEHKNIVEVEDRDKLKVGAIEFTCLLLPGHTPGCQAFLYKNVLISGDVIFVDGCGRCDLPGGDASLMYRSLFLTIKKLPDETIIFPGHNYGPSPYATIGEQKKTNPYLTASDEQDFLIQRMGMSF